MYGPWELELDLEREALLPLAPMKSDDETVLASASTNSSFSSSASSKEDTWLFDQRARLQEGIGEAKALANLVKSLIGTGILALPLAFYHAGLWTGIILTMLICLLNLYCMHMLVNCAHYCGKRTGIAQVDYAALTKMAFDCSSNPLIVSMGPYFSFLTNFLIMVNQLGFCCVYILFMATNISQVVHNEDANINLPLWVWMLLLLPFVTALAMVRHLRLLAPAAMLANVLYLLAFVITFQYLFHELPSVHSRPAFNSITTLPLFFGTVMFSFEGICVVLPIENRMYNPGRFIVWNGVLNVGCLMVIGLYMSVGFFGYLRFGPEIKDSITLNLPHLWYYQSVRIIVSLAILVTYAVQFYVPLEIIEKKIIKLGLRRQNLAIYGVRLLLVLLTFLLAEIVPYLGLFISLIGSLAGAGLALIMPPLIDTLVMYNQPEHSSTMRYYVTIRNSIIALIGFVGFLFGSYSSLREIILKLF